MTDQLTLPEGFTSVDDQLPAPDKPVLAIRRSGYTTSKFEVVTALYEPDFRPRNPWQTLGHDAITESGEPVLGWRYADEWLVG